MTDSRIFIYSLSLLLALISASHVSAQLASCYNDKSASFTSKFYQPGTSGVNAFCQDWGSVNNWLCPLSTLRLRLSTIWKLARRRESVLFLCGVLYISGLRFVVTLEPF